MRIFLLMVLSLLLLMHTTALLLVIRGPRTVDRLISATTAVNILTFVLALAGVMKGSEIYFDAALVSALLSFSSAIIVTKFITAGRVM